MIEFIAEVSSNHSKDLSRCFKFIDKAHEIGCTSIKFQLFKIDQLFAPEVLSEGDAQIHPTVTKQEFRDRKKWELPVEFLPEISNRCKEKGIKFGCTPFYLDAVRELEPFVDFYKVASYELMWDDLLIACARTGKQVIISTGMANLKEIIHAVKILRGCNCEPHILHCISAYPAPYKDANLSAIETIRKETSCEIGWSDHTVDPGVIHRSIHRWNASIIEFHLDLDGLGEEFEPGHCWLPNKMKKVIQEVNHGVDSDGSGVKEPVMSEILDRQWRTDPSDGLRPLISTRASFSS
jgi:sialic acid synthase SpsE